MSTKGTKIVKTVSGDRVRVYADKVVQIEHQTDNPFYATAEEIGRAYRRCKRKGTKEDCLLITEITKDRARWTSRGPSSLWVGFSLPGAEKNGYGYLGCSSFEAVTFADILLRLGILKTARQKAFAAKAGVR